MDRALAAEPQIGTLLPCNVVVRVDESDRTVVEIMNPNMMLALTSSPDIAPIAREARARLERVLAAL